MQFWNKYNISAKTGRNIEVAKYEKGVPPVKLRDQVRAVIRKKHYSIRTEQAYVTWIKRFILFHRKRHPKDMGAREISQYISHLATDQKVAASTQNQALNAIVFLYKHVLRIELGDFGYGEGMGFSGYKDAMYTLTRDYTRR